MLSEFSFLSTTLFTSSLVVAAAAVGIYVLPWTRRQLEVSSAAWAYAGELVGAFGRRFFWKEAPGVAVVSRVPASPPRVELPEIGWDVTGDWTTATS